MLKCGLVTMLSLAVCGATSELQAQVPGMMGGEYAYMDGGMAGGTSDQLYPFDNPAPWLHGQFQVMPAYGGHVSFRPYNYKHIGPQSRMAGMMGAPTSMPYSQQFWHRYAESAAMEQVSADSSRNPLAPRVTQIRDRRVLHASGHRQLPVAQTGAVVWPHALVMPQQAHQGYVSTPLEQGSSVSTSSREAEIRALRQQIESLQSRLRQTTDQLPNQHIPLLRAPRP